MHKFDRYIGIDWAGAQGNLQPGIKVAACDNNIDEPKLQPSIKYKYLWSREQLADWLIYETINTNALIGIDFAFAYPYCCNDAYYPGKAQSPVSVRDLWQKVDGINSGAMNMYGGQLFRDNNSPFKEYYQYQTFTGKLFVNSRFRKTEVACQLMGLHPQCTFKCVGPGSVGTGSAAGMRLLHYLKEKMKIAIWPFDKLKEGVPTLVEIYPRLFLEHADNKRYSFKLPDNQDEADALISAAALRYFSGKDECWNPRGMDTKSAKYEGWIFGAGCGLSNAKGSPSPQYPPARGGEALKE